MYNDILLHLHVDCNTLETKLTSLNPAENCFAAIWQNLNF